MPGNKLSAWLSRLSVAEAPDAAQLPRSPVERWLWLAAIWLASVALLGAVGLLIRFALKG